MAANLMSLPTELRLKVFEMVMASHTMLDVYLFWDYDESEMCVENNAEQSQRDPRTPHSLLLVSKTLYAEVSPIFYERLRFHLATFALDTGYEISGEEAEFNRFDVGDFLRVPKRVKVLSIETALAEQLAFQYITKDLRTGIASALPVLDQLIVYNSRNLEILLYDDWRMRFRRDEVISEVEDMYDVDADDETAPLHRFTPCRGHRYTLVQQVFFNHHEVRMEPYYSIYTF